MSRGRPRPRAPISLQLVGLLLVSLLMAQAVSFAIILLTPPPRPAAFRLTDVAAALKGGPLTGRFARPLMRSQAAAAPADLKGDTPRSWRMGWLLAQQLGVAPERVRVRERPSAPPWRRPFRMDRLELRGGPPSAEPGRGPMFEPRGVGPGFAPGGFGSGGLGPGGPPPWMGVRGPDAELFGTFAAAVRGEDGRWTVVRSTPEPFPNAWQVQTGLSLLAVFLVIAPLGYLFARRITAPLKKFAQAAETLGRDPQAPQMTLSGPAEIGAAAQAFNEMQGKLRRYVTDRVAMVGAISHDLRTPLARIRFRLEGAAEPMRSAVLSDVSQMEQMIAGVLAFIRDEGKPKRREKLDLLSLVECVVDDAALVGADVEVVDGRPVTVDGDPDALKRMLANLVDNAVRYGGEARVQVRQDGEAAVVVIADAGPGLSAEEQALVFQPFYRTDRSRNLDNAGVGLGLPIARSTARAHGGEVELSSGRGGLTAVVTLPTA